MSKKIGNRVSFTLIELLVVIDHRHSGGNTDAGSECGTGKGTCHILRIKPETTRNRYQSVLR